MISIEILSKEDIVLRLFYKQQKINFGKFELCTRYYFDDIIPLMVVQEYIKFFPDKY